MRPVEYRGSLTREQFLFYETRIVAQKILEGKEEKEIYDEIVNDNLFQFPTEKNIRSIARGCYKRLTETGNKKLISLIAQGPSEIAKQAALYSLMMYNAIVYDFMVEVIGEKYKTHDDTFDRSLITRFCSQLREKNETASSWSDATIKKIRSVLLRCLVEAGYLNNAYSKELNTVYLYEEVLECVKENGDEDVFPAFNYFE